MPDHTCPRCLQNFPKKYNLVKHMKRKIRCLIREIGTDRDDSVTYSDSGNIIPRIPKIPKNIPKNQKITLKSTYIENRGISLDKIKEEKSSIFERKTQKNRRSVKKTKLTKIKKSPPCDYCGATFSTIYNLNKHVRRYHPNENEKNKKPHKCEDCGKKFSSKRRLAKHIDKYHDSGFSDESSESSESSESVESEAQSPEKPESVQRKIAQLQSEIEKLKKRKPQNHNHLHQNILQVLCVSKNDNYLEMLTEQWGDQERALGFINSCALSETNGDCRLIQQVYFNNRKPNQKPPIRYSDDTRRKIEFIDEHEQVILDPKGKKLGKILSNNLQKTYLSGINHLVTENLRERRPPNRLLEAYDLQIWNEHIQKLSQPTFYKGMIDRLDIPGRDEI